MTQTATVPVPTATAPSARLIDSKAALNISNKRVTISRHEIGQQVLLQVQGNGQFVAEGHTYTANGQERTNMLDKTIYGVKANSGDKLSSRDSKQLFTDGMKAESAGDAQKASDLFNAWLNYNQMSFNVISNGSERRFASGEAITAVIKQVNNTLGIPQLVLDSVAYKAPIVVAERKFEAADFLLED